MIFWYASAIVDEVGLYHNYFSYDTDTKKINGSLKGKIIYRSKRKFLNETDAFRFYSDYPLWDLQLKEKNLSYWTDLVHDFPSKREDFSNIYTVVYNTDNEIVWIEV